MNISKGEQRVLHALAQGGAIHFERGANGKVQAVSCYTRDGHILVDCSLAVFERLRKRRFIRSRGGRPYQVTRPGLMAVRAQLDNR
ncbi:MAG: YjhX family toxin [Marinibacterium sp.]|nr:YjhX family toxin [Marinibacterium sp.]